MGTLLGDGEKFLPAGRRISGPRGGMSQAGTRESDSQPGSLRNFRNLGVQLEDKEHYRWSYLSCFVGRNVTLFGRMEELLQAFKWVGKMGGEGHRPGSRLSSEVQVMSNVFKREWIRGAWRRNH